MAGIVNNVFKRKTRISYFAQWNAEEWWNAGGKCGAFVTNIPLWAHTFTPDRENYNVSREDTFIYKRVH